MTRPRHPNKELDAILDEAASRGWDVDRSKGGYFKALCPCGAHKKWVALTPSGANYATNLRMWFRRQPCWEAKR